MQHRVTQFLLLASASTVAAADIVHVLYDPPREVVESTWETIDIDGDSLPDMQFSNSFELSDVWGLGVNGIIAKPNGEAAQEIELGALIGPDSSFEHQFQLLLDGSTDGKNWHEWSDTGAYLGFRLAVDDGFQYGWFLVGSVRNDGHTLSTLTLYEFAYETEPNVAIPAGAVPAPGSLALLALGAAAASRRRTR